MNYSNININICGGTSDSKNLNLSLPWDAAIEDWKDAFKTILTHQTFSSRTIDELFSEEEFPLYSTSPNQYDNFEEERGVSY